MNQLNAASTYSRLELKNISIDTLQTLGKCSLITRKIQNPRNLADCKNLYSQ